MKGKYGRQRKYATAMAKVAFWAIIVFLVSLFIGYCRDSHVPEEIPETWKVRMIDAAMRLYKHLVTCLVNVGLTDHFSPLDRKLADWFILTQMTGHPWGMSLTADQTLKIKDTVIAGVQTVVYEPVANFLSQDRPVLVFLHGGGWSTLSVDSYDPLVRKIARESGVVIISVNYRLSPQYPYPVPLQDSLNVVNYVVNNPDEFRVDPQRIAVGGDSSGGNMAASIALRLKHKLAMQILVVPALQFFNFQTTSTAENSMYFHDSVNSPTSVLLVTNYLGIPPEHSRQLLENNHTSRSLRLSHMAKRVDQKIWMRRDLVRNKQLLETLNTDSNSGNEALSDLLEELITNPYVVPLMADDKMLRATPEAYIVTCGYDVIRDDGVMFAQRLNYVGTKVTHKHYKSGFHHAWFFPHGPLKVQVGADIVNDLIKFLSHRL
ncbi:neutral cholesterol ester hydrolase 1-like [Mya arenaria]|nr:neutral cholesterol ester hydrolase 1-like [Mya arenaria]